MEQEVWQPATAEDLKVGDSIRIDHRWFDHPFERRMFRISSEEEIGTIREQQLTRVFVNRTEPEPASEPQSATAEPAPSDTPPAADTAGETTSETTGKTDDEADAARQAARMAEQRVAIESARARDRHTREQAQQTLGMLSAGHQDSAAAVATLVDYLVAILNNSTSPLAPLAPAAPRNSKVRLALLGSDAVWLAALIGKRMKLVKEELRVLTHAAAVHAVGLTRMPPNLPEEQPGVAIRGTPLANYPVYGALLLQQCGSFAPGVVRIVTEHREKPDGSGLPRGLKGEKIHPHALIIGAIRELQVRCAGSEVAPAMALAAIYKSLRDTYGTAIVNHLAAAVLVIPVGAYVQLSDGSVARILQINETARLLPVVESFGPNADLRAPQIIDLSQNQKLFIVRALDTSRLPPKMFDAIRNTGPDTHAPQLPEEGSADAGEAAPEATTSAASGQ